MKKAVSLLLIVLLLCSALPVLAKTTNENMVDNWYEIFVYSFYDSDGDRIGDFNGLTQKLDYVKDMGFGGIWLMPIHPSPSYHKYDVTDYYAIDPAYGTLEDFQAMLARAKELNIKIILDLVVNHTSNLHPWFQSAKADVDSPYRDYYNFSLTPQAGYNALPSGWYYESRFVTSMPDLNLDNPAVRDEIEAIMRYWLDMGVDGFRLDAVTSYYTGNRFKNVEFLSWLQETADAIKPDCFIVGEAWEDLYTIAEYYKSGMDSFFLFPTSQGGGYIAKILGADVNEKGTSFGNVVSLLERNFPDVLMTPFLGNHDTQRIASALGYNTATNIKMAAGLLSMLKGSIFVYYGDEIGMTGTGNDPNKRIGIFWDKKMTITACPPGTTTADYPFPSVEKQQADALSILSYYKQAMALRNQHPEIARGVATVLESGDKDVCILQKDYDGSSILLAINLSIDDVTLVNAAFNGRQLVGELEIWGNAAFVDDTLTVPAYGIAVLR